MNSTILFGFKRHLLQKKRQIQTFTFKTAILLFELGSLSKKKTENEFRSFLAIVKKIYFNLNALS